MKRMYLYFLLLLSACTSVKKEPAEKPAAEDAATVQLTAAQVKQAGIETGVVTEKKLQEDLRVNGEVDVPPQNIVSVSFPMGGYLKTTKLLPGMHVQKGEVIGVMEDQGLVQLQQDYLVAVAKLMYLQQDFERQRTLNENNVNAAKILQQAHADYTSQKVLVKGYAEKLRLIGLDPRKLDEDHLSRSVPLYSPINGFVSKVNVNIGRFVNPTDVLFELINPDDLHASLTVFEKDMPYVKVGQPVQVSFVDQPEKEFDCEIILVTRNVDENRSGTIHCHFKKMPRNLLPGMFLNATIHLSTVKALAVPEEAVVRYAGKQFVVVVTAPYTYALTEVVTGTSEKGWLQIKSNAALAGATIVTKNAYSVLGKMKNVEEEE